MVILTLAGVPIQNILFTVFQSIFQVFILCLAGFTLCFKGIVDKSTSKALNHINIALFTPALLFSKVAYFLSPAKLRQLWIIPIFFVIVTGLSALVAHWLARALRLKRSQANFAIAAAMFMNSNSLPVALMQSLSTTVPLLKWGPDDTVDAMFGRSLTYLVVFSTLGMILRWSYGMHLISQVDEPDPPTAPTPPTYRDSDDADHSELVNIADDSPSNARLIDYESEPNDRNARFTRPIRSHIPHPSLPPTRRHTHPHYYIHSRLPAVPTSLGDQSESEDTDDVATTEGESEDTIALPSEPAETGFSTDADDPAPKPACTSHPSASDSTSDPDPGDPAATPRWSRHHRSYLARLVSFLTSLSPPLVASLLALFCVLVPPIQRLLNSAEMVPLKGALDNAGGCSIPVTLLVLGGWFWPGETKPKGTNKVADGGDVRAAPGVQQAKLGTTKGKGVETRRDRHAKGVPSPADDHPPTLAPVSISTSLRVPRVTSSRNSSTASLSSMIGAFGDVLMARIHPRGSARRAKRRAGGSVVPHDADVESGPLTPHAENGHGHTALRSRSGSRSESGGNIPGETRTIVVTLLARMIIVPLVVTPMMMLVSRFGWGGEVFEDPVFVVSSMLLVSSPPALTLAQISQRAKAANGGSVSADADEFSPFERLLSRTVFWAYTVLTPPITILSVMVGLLLVGA